jgi:RHS repeat-associated protein
MTLLSGIEARVTRDALDRATRLEWRKGDATVASYAYALGPTGQRLSVVDHTGRRVEYQYDVAHRLVGEAVTGAPVAGAVTYTLDATGNQLARMSTVPGLSSATYEYDANDRLTSDLWDPNGNSTSLSGSPMEYDFRDRLLGKGPARLIYDGTGVLVGKTVGGVTTRYLVDELGPSGLSQVLDEVVTPGSALVSYAFGPEGLVSQAQRAGADWVTTYAGTDAHGSVTFLTDPAGAVTSTQAFDAWGNLLTSSGAATAYRYQGQRWDEDVGLYQLRARWYEPGRGRFVTGDPILGQERTPLSWNRYLYGNGDPANLIDPRGLATEAPDYAVNSSRVAAEITSKSWHRHHIFPRQFKEFFWRAKIDIEQFTVKLGSRQHLKTIHGSGSRTIEGQWNSLWDDFFLANKNPSKKKIFDFALEMMDDFRLLGRKVCHFMDFQCHGL